MAFNIAVFVSGNGSNLQAIIDKVATGQLLVNIAVVISDKAEAYALKRAEEAGIPHCVVTAQKDESRRQYDERLVKALQPYSIDLIVLSGFMRILAVDFVERYAGKIINIHPSLLPAYPGLDTHRRVIEAGEVEHGTTVHYVTPELDAGPVIAQKSLLVDKADDESSLQHRVQALEYDLYWRVIAKIASQTQPR